MASDEGSTVRILMPAIVGLILGVAFIVSFAFLISSPPLTLPHKPPIDEEFKNIEHIPEVNLFLEKYGDYNSTKGFSRFSDNSTIKFTYTAGANVDKDGDGIKEANRRLDLTISYDESGGNPIYKSYDPARIEQVEIRCGELTKMTPDIDKAFTDIVPPAYDGQVKDFIGNTRCLC